MTAIIGTKSDEFISLFADRVAFEGPNDAITKKIFDRGLFAFAIVGECPSTAITQAKTFDELVVALEAQHKTGALIVSEHGLSYYNPFMDDKADKVRQHLDSKPLVIGCYRGEVTKALESGLTEVDALARVHLLWGYDPKELHASFVDYSPIAGQVVLGKNVNLNALSQTRPEHNLSGIIQA